MFNTVRTSARTLLVAASAAGFVALGSGIAGADALGGATGGLLPQDLGSQVPASLTQGVSSPVGDLVKVKPGELSAVPEINRQSGPEGTAGHVVGDSVSADTPVEGGKDNAANVGPLDLNTAEDVAPLTGQDTVSLANGSVDPIADLLGGLLGGSGTLPLAHTTSGLPAHANAAPARTNQVVRTADKAARSTDRTADELSSLAGRGTREVDTDLVSVDEVVPMAGQDTPVALDTNDNTNLNGGVTDLLPEVTGELPETDTVLPMAAPEVSTMTDLLATDSVGGDLVGVDGLPRPGEPEVDTDQVTGLVTGDMV